MQQFGVIDNRFLAKSVGLLRPRDPLVLSTSATLRRALEVLRDNKVGCVIAVNSEEQIAGILSERDIILKVSLENMDLDQMRIETVMTPNPVTIQMTTTLAYAFNLMSQGGYRHLPVVDEMQIPVGIVSVKNLIDFISHSLAEELGSFSGS